MSPVVFFTVCGLVLLAGRLLSERPGRARDHFRSIYLNQAYVVPMRMLAITSPVVGVGTLAMGLAMLLPRYYAAWLASAGASLVVIAMVLSYRPPTRFLPNWFREEIADGTLPPIRTDLIDRVIFAMLLAIAISGPISLVLLIVVFGAAGSP